MRVSDADRNEVAEALSKHYGDGRLDALEFQERLDRAMSAKTRADLSGLLTDLPGFAPLEPVPAPAPARPPRRHRYVRGIVLLVLLFAAFSVVTSFTQFWFWHVPWLVIGLIAFLILRRDHYHRSSRYRRRVLDERPW